MLHMSGRATITLASRLYAFISRLLHANLLRSQYSNHKTLMTLSYGHCSKNLNISILVLTRRISIQIFNIDKPDEIHVRDVFTHYAHTRLILLRFIGFGLGRISTGTERILEESQGIK